MAQLTDLTPEGEKYMKKLAELVNLEVHVGFQGGEEYEDGVTVASVAAANELGSSTTPARPFMKQSFENHEQELRKSCEDMQRKIASGVPVKTALNNLGVAAKGLIQEEIVEGNFAPNAPSTIRAKKSDRPLVDSGHMRQSVSYVIEKKR